MKSSKIFLLALFAIIATIVAEPEAFAEPEALAEPEAFADPEAFAEADPEALGKSQIRLNFFRFFTKMFIFSI